MEQASRRPGQEGNGFAPFPVPWAQDPTITPAEKAVLLGLLSHRHGWTGPCFPSHDTLAAETGLAAVTVGKVLRRLREKGLIEWTREGRSTNRYTLHTYPPGQVTPIPQDVSDRSPRTAELEEGNQMKGTRPSPGDAPLPGLEVADRPQEPTAGHLVAAWCERWTSTHGGRQPDPSVVKRVAGSCAQVARTRTDRDSWVVAWRAAGDAGARGTYDVVQHLAERTAPRNGSVHGDHALDMILGAGQETLRGSDPPMLEAP